jgi:hypothetical protein
MPRDYTKEEAVPRGIPGSGPGSIDRTDHYGRNGAKPGPVIELEWGDPPPDVPAALAEYLEVLEELRAKPDEWARLASYPSNMGAPGAAKKLNNALVDAGLGGMSSSHVASARAARSTASSSASRR